MLAMWPALPGFKIEAVDYIDDRYCVVARVINATANCPNCMEQSSSLHSWYKRMPHGLPSCGTVLRLCLQVRRFSATTRLALVRFFANDYPNLSRNTHVVPND
jgi:hypothetical protein